MATDKALKSKLDRQIKRFRNLEGRVTDLEGIVIEILKLRKPKR